MIGLPVLLCAAVDLDVAAAIIIVGYGRHTQNIGLQ